MYWLVNQYNLNMKITDLIKKEAIDLNVKASTKKEIIEKAVELMSKNQNITNKEDYLKLVLEREEKGTAAEIIWSDHITEGSKSSSWIYGTANLGLYPKPLWEETGDVSKGG